MMFVPFQQPPTAPVKQVAKRTKSACINCKAAKVGCSSERPCLWCLRHDLQDTCVDAPKKTRNTKRKLSSPDDKSPSDDAPATPPTPPPSTSSSTSTSTSTSISTASSRGHQWRTSSPRQTESKPSSPTTSSTHRSTKDKPPEYDSADSDTPELSTSSPPPATYKFAPNQSILSQGHSPSFPYSQSQSPYNSMLVSVPSTSVSPSFSATPTTSPSLSLPAPSSSPTSSLLPLSAFSSPFSNFSQNQNPQRQPPFQSQQPITQQTIPPYPPPPPLLPHYQYPFQQSTSYQFQQSQLTQTPLQYPPDSSHLQSLPDHLFVVSSHVKSPNQPTLSPSSTPTFQSPSPLYSSSFQTTSFASGIAFDSDEDIS